MKMLLQQIIERASAPDGDEWMKQRLALSAADQTADSLLLPSQNFASPVPVPVPVSMPKCHSSPATSQVPPLRDYNALPSSSRSSSALSPSADLAMCDIYPMGSQRYSRVHAQCCRLCLQVKRIRNFTGTNLGPSIKILLWQQHWKMCASHCQVYIWAHAQFSQLYHLEEGFRNFVGSNPHHHLTRLLVSNLRLHQKMSVFHTLNSGEIFLL